MENLESGRDTRQHAIAYWLLAVCVMIYVMVILGGVTRLTYSGLSMVDWKPLTGWLPPMTDEAWRAAFADYQRFPEYRDINAGMTLGAFKGIFLMEYFHRLWGRLIGLAFLIPFVVFLIRGWIGPRLLPRLLAMFVLGGLQGALGWYMVKSGLIDRPDVSPYRLTAHLGLALIVYAYILWVALGLLFPAGDGKRTSPIKGYARGLVALVFLTILSGGFVAGNDAGLVYNTFPTMNGEWWPKDLFAIDPFIANFFEDVTTVQFDHRVMALVTATLIVVFWARSRGVALAPRARWAADLLVVMVLVQVFLGIATLLLVVPVPLAATHQAGAVALLTLALWNAFEQGRAAVAS